MKTLFTLHHFTIATIPITNRSTVSVGWKKLRLVLAVWVIAFLTLNSYAQHTKLLDFTGANGFEPWGSLISDGTFLYGMTSAGGTNNQGTLFKILGDGTGYVKLLDFAAATNGSFPFGSLIYDGTFLYGMASQGGANNMGIIFKIKPDGTGFAKLLDFAGTTNGDEPNGALLLDGGFLYGMTTQGGTNNMGTVFKIMTNGTGYAKLLDFAGTTNGAFPFGSLVTDGTFLYGMTSSGGGSNLGAIFKIKFDGTGYVKLLNFTGAANGKDPLGSLIFDGTFLYGMTESGGSSNDGVIFKIKTDGSGYVRMFNFNLAIGDQPFGDLISDGTFLYGMTYSGGSSGTGNIFKIKTDATGYQTLHEFADDAEGWLPYGSLILQGSTLYGMTQQGGPTDGGTLFKFELPVSIPTITNFSPGNGTVGTTVTIMGTNFSATPSNNIVFFGATRASVSASTSTQLTVTVPVGATYESISVLVNGLAAYSSKPFIVTFADGGVIDVCTFATKVDVTTGTEPYSVAIGDLDNDGKPDLAVANQVSNTVSVFKNISTRGSLTSGSFATKVDFTTNTAPYYVGIKDLDGDGKPELIVSNNDDDNVSIYKNTTTTGVINASSFAPRVDFTTGENPWNGTIDDFDLDGKPDLAIVNDVGNSISILRNTSTIGTINSASFAPRIDFATGNFPIGIASGDLDGDGKADIVATNQTDNSISVLRNTSTLGSISFAAKADLATGLDPYSVTIGDLDGNGKPEVIVANFSSGTASVFNNASTSGVITLSAKVDFDSGSGSLTVALNDIDGDGKIDLTVTNGGNRISVLKNINSSAPIIATSFSPRVDFQATNLPYGFVLGDLDGNGKPDIAAANSNGTTVSLLRNTVTSLPPFTASSFSPASGSIGTIVTLTGTNFSTTPINNTVKFNGIVATVTASTSTSITAIVPTGATTGPISLEIGCTTAITVIPFTVTAGSTITFTTQPSDRMMCAGSIATFTIEATGTTNMVYQWQKFDGVSFTDLNNGGGYSGVNTSVLSISTTGNFGEGDYRCTVSGDNAASIFSQAVSLSFTTNSTIAEITIDGTTLTASPGDGYQWYQNDDIVVGAIDQSFDFSVLEYGKYKVDVTDNGCTSTSEEFEYLITDLEHLSGGIKLYPNPVEENLSIEYRSPYVLSVVDVTGKVVYQVTVKTETTSVDMSSLSKGLYLLQLKNDKGQRNLRISKK